MAGYQYSISLRIFHATRTLNDVTDTLGIEPTHRAVAGAPRMTLGGRALRGVNRQSYWTASLWNGNFKDQPLCDALAATLDRLEPHREFLVDLVASGARAEFFIGWFFDEGNSGDAIDHALLARLASFRIDLHFDVYPDLQST